MFRYKERLIKLISNLLNFKRVLLVIYNTQRLNLFINDCKISLIINESYKSLFIFTLLGLFTNCNLISRILRLSRLKTT